MDRVGLPATTHVPRPEAGPGIDDDYAERPEHHGSHNGLLIAVGAVVLVAVVALIAFMWPNESSSPQFAVGTCVKNSGDAPVAVDCTAAGAFKVVSQVETKEQCADALQPHIELGAGRARILCLAPASGEVPTAPPSVTPAAGTT